MNRDPLPSSMPARRGTLRFAADLMRIYLPAERSRAAAGIAMMLAGSLLGLLQPWPLKLVVDCAVGGRALPRCVSFLATCADWMPVADRRAALLVILCAAMLAIQLLLSATYVWSTYLLVGVGLRMVFRFRCVLFEHVQRLSLRFHDTNPIGDFLYRIAWDTYGVQTIFNQGVVPTISATITICGTALILWERDWTLAAAALAVGGTLYLLVRSFDRPMTEHATRLRERESEVNSRAQESLGAIRAVQAFGQEQREIDRFASRAQRSLRANLRLTVLQAASQSAITVLLAAGTSLMLWVTARRVLAGRLSDGDLFLAAGYITLLFRPLDALANMVTTVQGAVAGARRVTEILRQQPEVRHQSAAQPLGKPARGELRLERVRFAYRPGCDVLRDFSLLIPAGTSCALVGPSGAGKTTIANLLLRFYDPDAGRVLLDDHELRDLPLASLRAQMALVPQEPVLFNATLQENIAYGRPGADPEAIRAAARAAGAHDFIAALPDGYDTVIGERGVMLSGGQRQRLSIARAFLKDAPILILDEPTSALDSRTETDLVESLRTLMRGRTTVIIAHRLSTVRFADCIVVLCDGGVEESGRHEHLLAAGGRYAGMVRLQEHLHPVRPKAEEAGVAVA